MFRQLVLFDDPRILGWLPDETLYSLCARYHRLSSNMSPQITTQQLFGARKLVCKHDFPARLDDFVARTSGHLGDSTSIIRDRTLLPFYLPFVNPTKRIRLTEHVRRSQYGSVYPLLDSKHGGFSLVHPLKTCNRCMVEDTARHGTAYWHRIHQLPTVWVCPTHGVPLSERKHRHAGRVDEWVLPHTCGSWIELPNQAARSMETLQKLALVTTRFMAFAGRVNQAQMSLSLALRFMGYPTPAEVTPVRESMDRYLQIIVDLRRVPFFASIPDQEAWNLVEWQRLLGDQNPHIHPVCWLTMVAALTGPDE